VTKWIWAHLALAGVTQTQGDVAFAGQETLRVLVTRQPLRAGGLACVATTNTRMTETTIVSVHTFFSHGSQTSQCQSLPFMTAASFACSSCIAQTLAETQRYRPVVLSGERDRPRPKVSASLTPGRCRARDHLARALLFDRVGRRGCFVARS
jgi:hypothetical protein